LIAMSNEVVKDEARFVEIAALQQDGSSKQAVGKQEQVIRSAARILLSGAGELTGFLRLTAQVKESDARLDSSEVLPRIGQAW
jgi:hypothetical protein